jgi:uncharacterized protein (UPF0333 family)
MKSLSLKWGISLWISGVLVVVITTISIVASVEFQESHLRNMNQTLLAMANGIAASLDNYQNTEVLIKEVRSITGRPGWNPSTFYRVWMDGSSTDLLASDTTDSEYGRWLHDLPDHNNPSQEKPVFVNMGHR